MTWDYRVVRQKYEVGDEVSYDYGIHEAHYGAGSPKPTMITVDQVSPYGETPEGLRECLEMMSRALKKPVLDYETREEVTEI